MSDYPYVRAAFINAIREEGTKTEACDWLQKEWNARCYFEAKAKEAAAEIERLRGLLKEAGDAVWNEAIEAAAKAYRDGSFCEQSEGWDWYREADAAILALKREGKG